MLNLCSSLVGINTEGHNVFTHFTVDVYLDIFHFCSIVTSASMNILMNTVHIPV